MKRVLAFDFGASSGRAIIGSFDGEKISLREVHRFSNDPVMLNGTLYWDVLRLFYEIKQGIVKAKIAGGFDTKMQTAHEHHGQQDPVAVGQVEQVHQAVAGDQGDGDAHAVAEQHRGRGELLAQAPSTTLLSVCGVASTAFRGRPKARFLTSDREVRFLTSCCAVAGKQATATRSVMMSRDFFINKWFCGRLRLA